MTSGLHIHVHTCIYHYRHTDTDTQTKLSISGQSSHSIQLPQHCLGAQASRTLCHQDLPPSNGIGKVCYTHWWHGESVLTLYPLRPSPCQLGPNSRSLKATCWAHSRAERRLAGAVDSLLWSLRSHFQRETEAQSFELLRVLRTGEKDPVSLALCSSSAGLAEPLPLTSHCYHSVSPVPPLPLPAPNPSSRYCSEAAGSGAPDFAEQANPEVLSRHNGHWPDLPLFPLQGLLSRGYCSLEVGAG